MLTAFEGGRATDGSGDTLMDVILLTDQDKPLIEEYTEEGHNLIAGALKFAVKDLTIEDGEAQYEWKVGNSLATRSNTKKLIVETCSAYVMWQWLQNKAADRSKSYKEIHENMLGVLARQANKVKPTLD